MILAQQKTIEALLAKVGTVTHRASDTEQNDCDGTDSMREMSDISSSEDDYSDTENPAADGLLPSDNVAETGTKMSESRTMLSKMKGDFSKEAPVGEKIDQFLAEVVDSGVTQPIDRKIAKTLVEKQVRPDNCVSLTVPIVNKELWVGSSLHQPIKDKDKKFQTAQGYLTAGLIPLVKLMDSLLKTNQYKEFEMAKDAFQLLAYGHRDISNLRRQYIKPGINVKYHQLCNDNTPLTTNLLGDDLEKQLRMVDDMRKIGSSMARSKSTNNNFNKGSMAQRDGSQRFHPYGYHQKRATATSTDNQATAPFLGKRSRQHLAGPKSPNKPWPKHKKY